MGDIRWQFKFHFKLERDEMIATGFSTLIKIMAKGIEEEITVVSYTNDSCETKYRIVASRSTSRLVTPHVTNSISNMGCQKIKVVRIS